MDTKILGYRSSLELKGPANPPVQAFHQSLESARRWAALALDSWPWTDAKVKIFVQQESLLEERKKARKDA